MQSNLQIQCNPYQNTNVIFCNNCKTHHKIHIKSQGTLNSQNNIEKKKYNSIAKTTTTTTIQLNNEQKIRIDVFPKKTYRWLTGT